MIANVVPCTKCGKWVHGKCAKMRRVSLTLAKGFVCERCAKTMKRTVEPGEEFSFLDQMELVKSFCYLGKD